ncbi:TSC22 domain family protein 3 isoform X2 [Syngnathus scovelli]|uniref:TSC22 domain family protein 3 isoform X2 n=1 Tax=Syngnathus scovelli TaxID=161590 RepID=UPI00211043F2|nr:TSC22 domain family protein 3 isoform X2 [Syngnathus scovelli]
MTACPEILPVLNCAIVPLWEQAAVKGVLPYLEATMGQRHTCRCDANLPQRSSVCGLHLAEPPHRFGCHLQHFAYHDRPFSYSPPYSPSLFKRPDRRASGASVVAIDNKIEQAMDLVKNHLMYAVREEVEILKEQIKELAEKNNQLERENYLLKNLASPEQLEKFQSRIPTDVLLPLDNQSVQVTSEQQTCSRNTGSAV